MDLKECLIVASFCVLIPAQLSSSEIFELHSPPSVIGNVGQNAVLPCQISLGSQPQNMEVQWKKLGEDHDVNIYQFTTVTDQETFGPGYLGRAAVATKEGIATGNVSLMLKTVQVSDGGIYKCIVKSSHWAAESQTVLHIAAQGNVSIEVLGPEGEGIKLACKSAGWFPEPELQWLPKSSQDPQWESKQDHEQLFSVWSSITVLGDSGEITCSVYERSYSSMKQQSTILLSRDIFPHISPWLLAFWILFILTVLAVAVLAYFGYKEKQKKIKRKTDEEEQRNLGELEESRRLCEVQKSELEEKDKRIKTLENQLMTKESERQQLIQKLESDVKIKASESGMAVLESIPTKSQDENIELDHQSQSCGSASYNVSQTTVGQHTKPSVTGFMKIGLPLKQKIRLPLRQKVFRS